MEKTFDTWVDFKNSMLNRNALETLQHTEIDSVGYLLNFNDGIFYCEYTIKFSIGGIPNTEEVEDFENNFKSTSNKQLCKKTASGLPTFSPSLSDSDGLHPKVKTYKFDVVAGQINIFDIQVINEIKLLGGEYWVSNGDRDSVHSDDYVEFAVVDKDDVLGLFNVYGLTVGSNILELSKFIETDYIRKNPYEDNFHSHPTKSIVGTSSLAPGLYRRIIVDSSGTTNYSIYVTMVHYES